MVFKHVLVRLYLYFLFFLFFITFGLSMLLFAPIYKAAFAPYASYRDFRFFRVWTYLYKIIWRSISDKSYRAVYHPKLTAPFRMHTDQSLVRVRDDWHGPEDNCDICDNSCCVRLNCPLLGENGRCLSYGSLFFSCFICGRYPENQDHIDFYQCPKWEVRR